jgi:hypothetical protein
MEAKLERLERFSIGPLKKLPAKPVYLDKPFIDWKQH